jgi:diguanylate cyclase (GGDEF)-like protein/PAS domain S-box-containing protein
MVHLALPGIFDSVGSLQAFVDAIPCPVFVKNREHRYMLVNRAAADFFGIKRDELLGQDDRERFPESQVTEYWSKDDLVFSTGETNENEEDLTDRAGNERRIITRKSMIRLAAGDELLVAVITDVTEIRQAEAHNRYLAFHDQLTGLANRATLYKRLDEILGDPQPTYPAILLVDLDRFKEVNDCLGHLVGDELIQAFADRLVAIAGDKDLAVRLGGDEFVLLLADADEAEAVCARILDAAHTPFSVGGSSVTIGASIGVAKSCGKCGTRNELLRRADVALYRAKSLGRHRFALFSPEMDEGRQIRMELEAEMRQALGDFSQFELHFQPQVRSDNGDVVAMEALVRWRHPRLGLVAPSRFIPLAEETGLIVPLGGWILEEAIRQVKMQGLGIRVAVNVSPVQLRQAGFADHVLQTIARQAYPANLLELEITETAVFHANRQEIETLEGLRLHGVRIALDDFGTGYSTLSNLRQLAVDKIKIDRTFVKSIGQVADADAIVRALVQLGNNLGVETTAEGVETEEQRQLLRELGCTELQGFLIARPRPLAEIEPSLQGETHKLAS